MTSESKLYPFSCTVLHEPKSPQLTYFEKVQHPKEKSGARNLFVKVIRAVAEVYLPEKILGAAVRANFGLTFKSPKA